MSLRQKVKESDVTVEVDSPDSNLADTLNKIRAQYEKVAEKNRDDTESWYRKRVGLINKVTLHFSIS